MAFLMVIPRESGAEAWIATLHRDDAHPCQVTAGLHVESWADVLSLSQHHDARIDDAGHAVMRQMTAAGVGPLLV
jgi:hypothetical protein